MDKQQYDQDNELSLIYLLIQLQIYQHLRFFKGETTHLGAAASGTEVATVAAAGGNPAIPSVQFCGSRFFPRNSSSVIQSIQIKVNGGIKVDIPEYNFVYNMLHDYTQGLTH